VQLFEEMIVAVDVQNPLLGPAGCTRIYGPQKGLRTSDFAFAERCLENLSSLLARELHLGNAIDPGAGAAGGLGFGLKCFAGAKLVPGFDLFARHANLSDRIRAAQLIITGEGSIDESTLMGKGVGEVVRLGGSLGVPCIGMAGVVTHPEEARKHFAETHSLAPEFTSAEAAKAEPALWLKRLAARVASQLKV
jgi:glycerate kinase